MKSKRIVCAALALILICSLTFAGCGKKAAVEDLVVTYVTSPLNVPSIVEKNHSIFAETMKEVGVKSVSYSEITSGADQTQALASGIPAHPSCLPGAPSAKWAGWDKSRPSAGSAPEDITLPPHCRIPRCRRHPGAS